MDKEIFDLIAAERRRQEHGIELIASENFVSEQVMAAMGSPLTNKYAEGYPGARYYGGCEVVDKVESLAISRLCELYGAEWANVQPHSGAQANMAVFVACMKPGDTFLGLDLSHGGHLSHGSPVNFSGLFYKAVGYKVDEATGTINYDEMERLAVEHKPRMIVGGASAYSREWDYARLFRLRVRIADSRKISIREFLLRHHIDMFKTEFLKHSSYREITGSMKRSIYNLKLILYCINRRLILYLLF